MKSRRAMVIVVLVFLLLVLLYRMGNGGIHSPAYGEEVMCEVNSPEGDGRAIQVVKYNRLFFILNSHEIPHRVERYRVRFKRGGLDLDEDLTPEKDDWAVSERKNVICGQSAFVGNSVFVMPVFVSINGFGREAVMVSADGGRQFFAYALPRFDLPPFRIMPGSRETVGFAWLDENASFVAEESLQISQLGALKNLWEPGVVFVIRRRVKSQDAGKTWYLIDYQILRPDVLPSESLTLGPINSSRVQGGTR